MKEELIKTNTDEEPDTLRPEYDFSNAVRGVTAKRFAEGTNIILLDRDVAEVFPNSTAVNEALRGLADIIKKVKENLLNLI